MNTTETNLIFEAYAKSKIISEGYEDNESREKNIMRGREAAAEYIDPDDVDNVEYEDDQFGGMEPEEDESVGDFDEFIGKAEKFVDAIGDAELEFLVNISKEQFEVLMDVVKDQHGYRSQMSSEDDEHGY